MQGLRASAGSMRRLIATSSGSSSIRHGLPRALATVTMEQGSDSRTFSGRLQSLLGLGVGGLVAAAAMGPDKEAQACGIVGVVGAEDARQVLLEGA